MKRLFKLLPLWLALLIVSACHTPQPAPASFDFIVLQLNDVYEIAPLEGGKAGGLARVAALRQQLLAENPNTLTVLAGDFMSPSLLANLKMDNGERIAGLHMIETLNALGLDYATFGNHEFDLSDGVLTQKRFQQCQFQFICSNVRKKMPDGALVPFTQLKDGREVPIPDYLVHTFRDEKGREFRLGITGVCLPFSVKDYVGYHPVESELQKAQKALVPISDAQMAITHLDAADDKVLGEKYPGFSLFIGGHDHDNMLFKAGNTLVSKADANAKTVYIHRCSYLPQQKKLLIQSTLQKIDPTLPNEASTQAVVDKWQNMAIETMRKNGFEPATIITRTDTALECKETAVRSRPTNFGQLCTRAFEMAMPGADVYLLNAGSLRLDDNLLGTITQYDILRTFPFGGGISEQVIPGNVLQDILLSGMVKNKTNGGYFQSHSLQEDQGKWLIRGNAIHPTASYKVVSTEFLASGKEANLSVFANYPAATPKSFMLPDGQQVRNDIRNLVITYLNRSKN